MNFDDFLKLVGCDSCIQTETRFLNDLDFYKEIIDQMLNDPGFDSLGMYIEQKKKTDAFNAAHTLKGIIANCGVTPLFDIIVCIVEPLRTSNPDFCTLKKDYEKLIDKRNDLLDKIKAVSI